MKNLFIYFSLLGMTFFGMWSSLTWDIPVDNQMFMFVLSCMCLGLFFLVLIEDIRNYFKSKKLKPQKF
jgi:predicted small integral membrane protein